MGPISLTNYDTLRGPRHELRHQAGLRFYRGRPALGYLSGVSPPVDAEVAEARDVILLILISGFDPLC